MDFIRHFVPFREARPKALSFNAPPATKTIESAIRLLIRTMRLTGVILLAFCLQVSARSDAQQRIAINVRNASLQKLFAEIEKKTNYTFFYDLSILKETKPVTIVFKDATVEDILKQALVGQSLEYTITDKTIFVKKERKAVVETSRVDTGHGGGIKVKGMVLTEAGGVPVQGANVTVKQTQKGTITNANGEFEFSYTIPAGSVLIFSFVGYAPQNITVRDGGEIRIYMKVAQNELDKAVVQAYGTTTQRLTTADIGKVTAEEIERQPVMNPLLALEGKVAGLDVSMTSGYASAPVKVELRGRASIDGGLTSDPLYIVDGVPLTVNEVSGSSQYTTGSVGFDQNTLSPAGGQNPFFSINPADIESIEVLKDADATAIYGSRGANGVILVTTKSGKPGRTKFDIRIQEGTQQVDRFWNIMNTGQYLSMRRQALLNNGLAPDPIKDYDINGDWDTTRYTNWQKVLYGGIGNNVDVEGGLSGGDAHTTFRIGGGYNRIVGITTVGGADQRASLSMNLNHRSQNQRLNIGLHNVFSFAQSNLINIGGSLLIAPDAPGIYDSLGNLNFTGWAGNNHNQRAEQQYPFGEMKQPYIGKTLFLNSGILIGFEILRGLSLRANLGCNIGQVNQNLVDPIASQDPAYNPTGVLNLGTNQNINWIVEPQMTYSSHLANGQLDVLVGASASKNTTEATNMTGYGYLSDLLIENISNAQNVVGRDYVGLYRYFGGFARISYNWENKYILNLNGRRDGSSRFGSGKQYGNFGSVGTAWIATQEHWIREILPSYISFFKFHGSYGTTGSDGVPNYSYLSQYSSTGVYPYSNGTSLLAQIDPNPQFRWQSNHKLEVGTNLGILRDRININVAWYRDRCGNQLIPFPTPIFTGFPTVIENSPALVQNTGWEFTANINIIRTDKFNWNITYNSALNFNKLVRYPNFDQSPYIGILKVGQPLNIQYVLHFTGIDQQTGLYSFQDRNHDGIINYSPGQIGDDSYPIVLAPRYFGGVGTDVRYKSLNINLFFNLKNQIGQNAFVSTGAVPGLVNSNQPTVILGKQWQYPGDREATYAKFNSKPNGPSYGYFARNSDGAFTNASYIRLSNLSISYSLPDRYLKKAGISGCNIFFHTNNLFVITKYKGLDPETQNFGGLPPTRMIVGGISLNM